MYDKGHNGEYGDVDASADVDGIADGCDEGDDSTID